MINNKKMNTKKILVSFLLVASLLFVVPYISASNDLTEASQDLVTVNDVVVYGTNSQTASVISGETLEVKVKFTIANLGNDSNGNPILSASNVRIKVELEGQKDTITEISPLFDVEVGKTYIKTLEITVPKDLDEEELSNNLNLNVKIWNKDYKNDDIEATLRVQKPSYELAIKSVLTPNTIETGQSVPIDVVLKNIGYNDAKDIFITVTIPELQIEKSAYVGDLVSLEESSSDDDETNTINARIYVEVPFTAKSGEYLLTVKAENEETKVTATKKIKLDNGVSDLIMKSGNDLVLINPTSKLRVYKIIYQSNEVAVVLPPTSSKVVSIDTPEGEYNFDAVVLYNNEVLGKFKFSGNNAVTTTKTDAVFVLTVILGIVFLVLLVALVVLIVKKPQKTEDFGESYY
jgi:ribosomal protein L31E